MVGNYVPPPTGPIRNAGGAGFDFFQGGKAFEDSPRPLPGQNSLSVYRLPKPYDMVLRCDLYVEDCSGGLDLMQTRIDQGYVTNQLADATLDSSSRRTLTLAGDILVQTGLDTGASADGLFWTLAFSDAVMIIGSGSGANTSLYKDDGLRGALEAFTFTPNGVIHWLTNIYIGGVSTDVRLAVLGSGAGEVLSDYLDTPTSSGDMHANTADCWWWFTSPLNASTPGAGTNIFQANNDIYTLSTTAAIGTAPTSVMSEINDGGYGIGICELPGSPPRIYFVQPIDDSTVSTLKTGVSGPGEIYSVNLEGTDLQKLKTSLPTVKWAMAFRNGIVYSDRRQIFYHDGIEHNLGDEHARLLSDNRQRDAYAIGRLGNDLVKLVVEHNTANYVVTGYWIERYNWEDKSWYPVTEIRTPATDSVITPMPSIPIGQLEGFPFGKDNVAYWFEGQNNTFDRVALAYPDWDLFYMSRNVDGNGTYGFHYNFASTGTATWPTMHFYSGFPKVWADCWFGGEFRGEDSQVKLEVATQTASAMSFSANQEAVFIEDADWKTHFWVNPTAEPETFDRLQVQETITQGTSGTGVERTSPNGLPWRMGFYVFLDGQSRPFRELEPWRYQNR